jgi:hypothetical protein
MLDDGDGATPHNSSMKSAKERKSSRGYPLYIYFVVALLGVFILVAVILIVMIAIKADDPPNSQELPFRCDFFGPAGQDGQLGDPKEAFVKPRSGIFQARQDPPGQKPKPDWLEDTCGKRDKEPWPQNHENPSGRIFHGERARLGEYPWFVSLIIRNRTTTSYCGAVLINSRWVLTAAHCLAGWGPQISVQLIFGENSRSTLGPTVMADMCVYHHSFTGGSPNANARDLFLLRIPKRHAITKPIIDLNENGRERLIVINNICLTEEDITRQKDVRLDIVGTGETDNQAHRDELMKGRLIYNYNRWCVILRIPMPQTLCVVRPRGEPRSGVGDSGGPLMRTIGVQTFLVGIMSYEQGFYTFATDVRDIFENIGYNPTWEWITNVCDENTD